MALTKISTAMWNSVPHHLTHDFNVDDVLIVDVSENKVGIGTDSPQVQLHVISSATTFAQVRVEAGADGYDSSIAYSQNGTIKGISGYDDSNDTVAIKYGTFGGNGIDIDSNGNVGIGTASPSNTLHIYKNATIGAITSTTTANAGLRIQDSGANMYFDGNSIILDNTGYLTTNGAHDFVLGTNNTARIHIDSGGNIGIGTISPSYKLDVSGTIHSSVSSGYNFLADKTSGGGIGISGSTGTTNYIVLQGSNSTNPDFEIYTGGSRRAIITSGGDVGIDTGNLTLSTQSKYLKFYHSLQTDANDGKIGAGVFDTGLNIVGSQTSAGTGRIVRMWGNVISDVSFQAPIFYDTDNTGYYVNPASTSNLNALTINRYFYGKGGTKVFDLYDTFLRFNQGNEFSNGVWFGTSDIKQGSGKYIVAGSNGGTTNSRFYIYGGTYNGANAMYLNANTGIGYAAGDWRAPIFYDSNDTGYYLNPNGASSVSHIYADSLSAGKTVTRPFGGEFSTTASTQTGAIKITLPHSWTNTMLRMTIKIYEYSTNRSFEVNCGGYNYVASSTWINPFAYIVGNPGVNSNYNVRFGHDGSKCCIYIGETSDSWSYMQIVVTDVKLGFQYSSVSNWKSGWSVGFATSFGSVSQTLSNSQVGRIADIIYDSNNTTYYFDGSATGDSIRTAGDIVAYYSSDRRLKDNIIEIDSALDKVNTIGGYTFEWNEDSHKETGKKDIGVIAQEVEKIFPEIVQTRSNGYKAVNYEKLVPLLIEAVKELSEKVKILENK